MKKAKLTIDEISLDLPIVEGSEKEKAIASEVIVSTIKYD